MGVPPLGAPGASSDGTPSRPNDQSAHGRRAFSYQDYAGLSLIYLSLRNASYTELWFEYHDDIVAVRSDGLCDIYQVKTRESDDSKWTTRDTEFVDIVRKFAQWEHRFGAKVANYYIYSNIEAYLPAEHATSDKIATSPLVLRSKLEDSRDLVEPYKGAFERLLTASNTGDPLIRAVFGKLGFVRGPALGRFRADAPSDLPQVDRRLRSWSIDSLTDLARDIAKLITDASTADLPPLDLYTSPVSTSGISVAELKHRRVEVRTVRSLIDKRSDKRKRTQRLGIIGVAVAVALMVWLVRPIVGTTADEHALEVVKSARGDVLPPDFKQSIAIIRASRMPLNGIDLVYANLACQDMSDLDLRRMMGKQIRGTGVIFDRAILASAVMSQSELNTSKWRNARMDRIDLDDANMLASNLYGVEARFSSFKRATLNGSNLSHAVISGADFREANLELTELVDADLSQSDFQGATLAEANISGTDLRHVKNLSQATLATACNDKNHPPLLDAPYKAPNRPCFTSKKEEFERKIRRSILGVVGTVAVTDGYCKKNSIEFRPPDSKRHPQGNERMFVPFDDLDDPPARQN